MKKHLWALLMIAAWLAGAPCAALDICDGVLEPTCRADLDGDEIVGTADLMRVLSGWGRDPDDDVSGDGIVDCHDERIVLGNWGNCPEDPMDINGDGYVTILDLQELMANCDLDCRFDLDRNQVIDAADVTTFDCIEGNPYPDEGLSPADFNEDGVVDTTDRLALLAALSDPADCKYDLNGDGEIGWSDVILVIEDGDK